MLENQSNQTVSIMTNKISVNDQVEDLPPSQTILEVGEQKYFNPILLQTMLDEAGINPADIQKVVLVFEVRDQTSWALLYESPEITIQP